MHVHSAAKWAERPGDETLIIGAYLKQLMEMKAAVARPKTSSQKRRAQLRTCGYMARGFAKPAATCSISLVIEVWVQNVVSDPAACCCCF